MKRKQNDVVVNDEPAEMKEDEIPPPDAINSDITWPASDIKILIQSIRSHIPKGDHFSFKSRMEKMPWDKIAFDKYEGPECLETLKLIFKKIRGYRLLEEMLNDAEKWLEKPWTNFYAPKSTKRHPDYPKRPLPPRILFQCENDYMRKDFKTMKEFQDKIGDLFEALPPEKREEYELKFQLKKEEFERSKNLFMLKNPDIYINRNKKPPVAFDNDSAFKSYIQDQLKKVSKHDSMPMKDLVDVFEQDWNKLSPSEKMVWLKKSKEKPKKLVKEEVKPKVKQFRINAYTVFSRKILKSEEIKKIPVKERMTHVSLLYKALKPEDIEQLKLEVAKEKSIFDSENPVNHDKTDSATKKRKKDSKIDDSMESQTSEMDDSPPKKKKKSKKENDNDTTENSQDSSNCNDKSGSDNGPKTMFPGEPETPPENPFDLFAKEKRTKKDYSDEKLLKKWNNLEKSVHKEYKKKLKELKSNYLDEYTTFVSSLSKKDLKKFTAFKKLV